MKSLIKILIMMWCICLVDGCKESDEGGVKPSSLVEYTVTPIHGGATITYTLPQDRDILYVTAEYERNGQPFTERSSVYGNSITIEGFNTTDPVSATLYTVSRDDAVKSNPLTVQFTPLESPIRIAQKSTEIIPCFGGVQISWENISSTELGMFLSVDSLGTLIEKEVYFSSMPFEIHSVRGFEAVETSFVLTFEDKWGNVSDPIRFTGAPLFEIEVPKPWTDLRYLIPYDNNTHLSNYLFSNLWDLGVGVSERYLSNLGGTGCSMTFDLRRVVKLSRFKMWNHMNTAYTASSNVYGQVHFLEFEMWGVRELDESKLEDQSYWLHPFSAAQNSLILPDHTFMDDWVYLGRHAVRRLDLEGASADDIWAQGVAGHEFDISFDCGPVRIIRFFPITTQGGSPPPNNYWQMAEFSFFGDYAE